jgi:hypothetical protein
MHHMSSMLKKIIIKKLLLFLCIMLMEIVPCMSKFLMLEPIVIVILELFLNDFMITLGT